MNQINIPAKKSGGFGGLLGSIVGGIAGAVAAPFTGGASIPAGMSLGGTIGGAVDPAKVEQPQGVSQLDTVAKLDPGVQNGVIREAQKSLSTDPRYNPDQAKELYNYLEAARQKNQEKLNLGVV